MSDRSRTAQVHMLEAVSATIILILAFLFIYTSMSSQQTEVMVDETAQLRLLGDDVLSSLDKTPPKNTIYSSRLVECLFNKSEEDMQVFMDYINSFLPSVVSYNVWLYRSLTQNTSLVCPSIAQESFGSVTQAHRLVVYQGEIYDVQLEMWYQ